MSTSQTGVPVCQDSRNTNSTVIDSLSQHAQVCKQPSTLSNFWGKPSIPVSPYQLLLKVRKLLITPWPSGSWTKLAFNAWPPSNCKEQRWGFNHVLMIKLTAPPTVQITLLLLWCWLQVIQIHDFFLQKCLKECLLLLPELLMVCPCSLFKIKGNYSSKIIVMHQ